MKTRKHGIRRKSKRGGQKVPYSTNNKWHKEYVKISQHESDCSASVFSLLGYTNWENSVYLASRVPNGLDEESFINMLKQAYGQNMAWLPITNLDEIHRLLDNGIATPASLEWDVTDGHYFVIIKENNKLNVFDPQTGEHKSLQNYLDIYKRRGYNPKKHFYIMDSQNVSNGDNRVTREIIDDVLDRGGYPAAQMFPPQRDAAEDGAFWPEAEWGHPQGHAAADRHPPQPGPPQRHAAADRHPPQPRPPQRHAAADRHPPQPGPPQGQMFFVPLQPPPPQGQMFQQQPRPPQRHAAADRHPPQPGPPQGQMFFVPPQPPPPQGQMFQQQPRPQGQMFQQQPRPQGQMFPHSRDEMTDD
jgi:hypothetical protein